MAAEIMAALPLRPGAVVLDGTVGLGGHAVQMAQRIAPGGKMIVIDRDALMLARAEERLAQEAPDVDLAVCRGSFFDWPDENPDEALDAVLLDLGLNNAQIEDPERGFSFAGDGPLDMRMDKSQGEPASAFLNRASQHKIETVLREYGDERFARSISRRIVERRKDQPLKTTADLVECVMKAIPPAKRDKRIHPATRTFQAIRIQVNDEIDLLEETIRSFAERLKAGGAMAVLSYHSGEDRAAKRAFRALSKEGGYQEEFKKPQVPSEEEVKQNPKSRSAKLRVLNREEAV
jgi:16S rRNA (cytosine1402-N4)-methyltransferase